MQGMSAAKWTDAMQREVQTFYLTHYRQHWCREHFSDAQQVIPTVSCLHCCGPAGCSPVALQMRHALHFCAPACLYTRLSQMLPELLAPACMNSGAGAKAG